VRLFLLCVRDVWEEGEDKVSQASKGVLNASSFAASASFTTKQLSNHTLTHYNAPSLPCSLTSRDDSFPAVLPPARASSSSQQQRRTLNSNPGHA